MIIFTVILMIGMYIKNNNTVNIVENIIESNVQSDFVNELDNEAKISNQTKIKVLLSTNQEQDYIHDQVIICSNAPFYMLNHSGRQLYAGNTDIIINANDQRLINGKLKLEPKEDDGTKFTIKSITRNQGNPSYSGTLEISKKNDGLIIMNELLVENYLYGVIPSEMPVSYGFEALKVQAVCARTYAYRALLKKSNSFYGADVDDTVSCQVYQNIEENDLAMQAVNDTKDLVLFYGDQIASTYFYSTSCGVTSDVRDVWGSDQKIDYLQPVLLNEDIVQTVMAYDRKNLQKSEMIAVAETEKKRLMEEENFKAFINNDEQLDFYEDGYSLFRWKVELNLDSIYNAVKNISDAYKKGFISGNIQSIEVTKRGYSGIVTELKISSEYGELLVVGQDNIRKVLNIENHKIYCKNGDIISGHKMLPSGYFYIKQENQQFLAYGGGFGHGVGMSQNGAAAMCENGMSFDEVLLYFYPNTVIKKISYNSNEHSDRKVLKV